MAASATKLITCDGLPVELYHKYADVVANRLLEIYDEDALGTSSFMASMPEALVVMGNADPSKIDKFYIQPGVWYKHFRDLSAVVDQGNDVHAVADSPPSSTDEGSVCIVFALDEKGEDNSMKRAKKLDQSRFQRIFTVGK
ncbi:hypothetical protein NDU88_009691 [Pleurodeles waltl]|uniref:EthD domain-containing protein n=1 Tax=Pleurodeles waltl TaxID=8319 RepID=A0AAV7RYB1_PLEWA|nr:hypothetical protein NDU88_009691 [Pleurodeles waltl]